MYSCMGTQWKPTRRPISAHCLLGCHSLAFFESQHTPPEVLSLPQGRLMHPKGAVLQTATFKTPTSLSSPTARSLFHKPELL